MIVQPGPLSSGPALKWNRGGCNLSVGSPSFRQDQEEGQPPLGEEVFDLDLKGDRLSSCFTGPEVGAGERAGEGGEQAEGRRWEQTHHLPWLCYPHPRGQGSQGSQTSSVSLRPPPGSRRPTGTPPTSWGHTQPEELQLQSRHWGRVTGAQLPRNMPSAPCNWRSPPHTHSQPKRKARPFLAQVATNPEGLPHLLRPLLSQGPAGAEAGFQNGPAVQQQTSLPSNNPPTPAKASTMGGGSDSRRPGWGHFSGQHAGRHAFLLLHGTPGGWKRGEGDEERPGGGGPRTPPAPPLTAAPWSP